MKHKALSLALILATLASPAFTEKARADVEVSFDYFQDALSPFGEWIEVGDYGLCWRPTGVGDDWAPYTDGYWAYTDAGWTWVSYEDWGGITYHYGRWVHVRDEGWVWVPEYEWAPAWVSWRSNNDYVGWAPLPPEARWEPEIGFSTWVDTSYDIGPDNYRFCHTRDFGSPFLAPVLLPCERNVTIIQSTVNITNISFYRGSTVIFNGGPNFVDINRHCRRPIPALNLVREDRIVRDDHGHAPAQVLRGNQLAVFAPKVARPADIRALPVKPQKVIAADRINRGWGRVADPEAQKELRKKLGAQTAGLTPSTAPARPPRAEELSSIPKNADPNAAPTRVLGKNKPPRNPDAVAGTPQVSPLLGQPIAPKRPRPVIDPGPESGPAGPTAKVPQASVPERPRMERPANTANPVKPFQPQPQPQPQPIRKSQRPPQTDAVPPAPSQPQTAAADENARTADKALRRQQREQQAAAQAQENAQRTAESTRRQQEAAQRSNEIRQQPSQPPRQQAQQADTARQQQEAAQRANELRNQQAQQQRQQARQAEASRQSQEASQRANELRSQQAQQQRHQARQADAMRQQQEASQRANEMRNFQAQQQRQQAQQAEAGRRQQEAAQRANEMRQQPQQVEVRRQQPPPQQAQQPAQPSRPTSKDGDEEKKKNRGR